MISELQTPILKVGFGGKKFNFTGKDCCLCTKTLLSTFVYGDLQLSVDRPCLWSGIALDLGSDAPGYNSTCFRFTWFSSVPEGKFELTIGFYHSASFHIHSSSSYTIHAMTVSKNKPKYFPLKFQRTAY
jgi:hypothetical protein